MFPFARDWPAWLRSGITDFAETALVAIFALSLVFPGSLDEARAEAIILLAGVAGAAVAAGRRTIPLFIAWFKTGTGIDQPSL